MLSGVSLSGQDKINADGLEVPLTWVTVLLGSREKKV